MKTIYFLMTFSMLGGIASAATIVQTQHYAFTPEASKNLTFLKFDTMGGDRRLDAVTFVTSVTKSGGSLFVDNDSEVETSGTISQSVTINLSLPENSGDDVALINSSLGSVGNNINVLTDYFVSLEADDGDGPGYQEGGADWGGTFFEEKTVILSEEIYSLFRSSYEGTEAFVIKATGTQNINISAVSGVAGSEIDGRSLALCIALG